MGKHISLAAIVEGQHITTDTCLGEKNVAVTAPFVHSFYSIYFFGAILHFLPLAGEAKLERNTGEH